MISRNHASLNQTVRSIISTENKVSTDRETVRFSLVPYKVFLFHKETEERIVFEIEGEQ